MGIYRVPFVWRKLMVTIFSPNFFFEATHIPTMDLRVFDQLDTFTNYLWASKWGKTLNLWLSYGSQIRHADIHMFFQTDESELAL